MKVYRDLSNEDYHAHGQDYISSSFVKSVAKHSVAKALEPFKGNDEALKFGDAFHQYIESPDTFNERFDIFDDTEFIKGLMERRPDLKAPQMTSEYKKFKSEAYRSTTKELLSKGDYDTILAMATNVLENPSVKQLNSLGTINDEWSYFIDDLDGLPLRVRPDRGIMLDVKSEVPTVIMDWKTCQDSSYKEVKKSFYKYGYDIQAVFYCYVLGIDPTNFYLVFVEKQSPYNCQVVGLDDETIERAREKMFRALDRIKLWKDTGEDGIEHKNEIVRI